jgi:hypothetical protein
MKICILALTNQIYFMKKLKKLTRGQLEQINGAAGNDCIMDCFCFTPEGEGYIGVCNIKGICC